MASNTRKASTKSSCHPCSHLPLQVSILICSANQVRERPQPQKHLMSFSFGRKMEDRRQAVQRFFFLITWISWSIWQQSVFYNVWRVTDYTIQEKKKKKSSILQNEPLHKVTWSEPSARNTPLQGLNQNTQLCHIFSTSCVMLSSAALHWPCKYTFICNHRFSWQASQL